MTDAAVGGIATEGLLAAPGLSGLAQATGCTSRSDWAGIADIEQAVRSCHAA